VRSSNPSPYGRGLRHSYKKHKEQNLIFQPISIRQRITTCGRSRKICVSPPSNPSPYGRGLRHVSFPLGCERLYRFQPISIRHRITTAHHIRGRRCERPSNPSPHDRGYDLPVGRPKVVGRVSPSYWLRSAANSLRLTDERWRLQVRPVSGSRAWLWSWRSGRLGCRTRFALSWAQCFGEK